MEERNSAGTSNSGDWLTERALRRMALRSAREDIAEAEREAQIHAQAYQLRYGTLPYAE